MCNIYCLCFLLENVTCIVLVFSRYARVEVPLHIVPSSGLGKACLESLIELPKILCQEEEEEYKKATADPDLDLITKLQNSSGGSTSHSVQSGIIGDSYPEWN